MMTVMILMSAEQQKLMITTINRQRRMSENPQMTMIKYDIDWYTGFIENYFFFVCYRNGRNSKTSTIGIRCWKEDQKCHILFTVLYSPMKNKSIGGSTFVTESQERCSRPPIMLLVSLIERNVSWNLLLQIGKVSTLSLYALGNDVKVECFVSNTRTWRF